MRKLKTYLLNFLLVILSVGVTFGLCEYIFRKALFTSDNNKAFDKYRQHFLYADTWDENYWKLAQIWKIIKPIKTHPFLGWNFKGWKQTLFHSEVQNLNGKRPVLLYGDSFAQCVEGTTPFETFLNHDSAFTENYHFINYGTGAYGVDQIYTMFKCTFMHYNNPVVIFSFLTDDLVRSCLYFREGQKPVYHVQDDGSLKLDTSRYILSNESYIMKYPPQITSYLWRKFLYSNVNFLPKKITQYLTGEATNRKKVIDLNQKIITDVIRLLRESKTDFIFLVFQEKEDYQFKEKDNWRVNFIRKILNENHVQYIWAEDLIRDKINLQDTIALDKYHIKNDGHPTTEFIHLIADQIKKHVMNADYEKFEKHLTKNEYIVPGQRPYYYTDRLDSAIRVIKSDSGMIRIALANSIEKKITLDKAITDFGIWMLWHQEEE
jgi:hypothetical protein